MKNILPKTFLNGDILKAEYFEDPIFGLNIPKDLNGIPSNVLNPRESWSDKNLYDKAALNLSNLFKENFNKYGELVDSLKNYGPK